MRHVVLVLLAAIILALPLSAQNPPAAPATPPPQSARQALIEMFMGKGPDDFAKHLPQDARRALIHQGETPETSTALKLASLGRAMSAQGENTETFDVGPNILILQEKDGHNKTEIAVEHDSLLGEEDEIELSIHNYKDGEIQFLPIIPRLIFTLKLEEEIWRVIEVTVAGHIPLTDPDYLKHLRKEQNEENENAAQGRVSVIATAETAYAAKHPESGYTCSLSTLLAAPTPVTQDASTPAQPTPEFFDSGQGSDDYSGYHFALTGCDGNPASKYRVTATPIDPDASTKSFCVDESGVAKSLATGSTSACFSRGQVLNQAPESAAPPAED